MLDDESIKPLAAALREHDPKLTQNDAEAIAWSVGDTPRIDHGEVLGSLRGESYRFPESLLYDGEEE
jgi:hypothetical protein